MDATYLAVVGYSAGVMTAAWVFFSRTPPWRPWIGVINALDVAVLFGVIAVLPYLYRGLPNSGTTTVLSILVAYSTYRIVEKVSKSRLLAGAISVLAIFGEIATAAVGADKSNLLLLVNGAVLALVIIGAANMLVKYGILARDVAGLAGTLALYDFFARSHLLLMDNLIEREGGRAFIPLFGWWHGNDYLAIGAADVLVAAMFPLAARKAFGKTAGLLALVASLAATALVLALVHNGVVRHRSPMEALGPLIVAQYCWWIRKRRRERPMFEYLRRESLETARAARLVLSPAPQLIRRESGLDEATLNSTRDYGGLPETQ
jgi:hypothetical protein